MRAPHAAPAAVASERRLDPISTTELERRWRAVRAVMAERGLEALVLQASQDWLGGYVKWLTDEPATNGYPLSVIFPRDAPMILVMQGPMNGRRSVSADDPEHRGIALLRFTPSYSSVHYTRHYDAAIVAEELERTGYRRVGLVGTAGMQYDFVDYLKKRLTAIELTDATDPIDALKAVKSPEEQERIRATAALQDAVIAAVRAWVTPGKRDDEIAAYAQYVAQTRGSEQGIFLGSSAPLGQPALFRPRHHKARTLRAGDHFSLLVEVNGPGGYYTEIARTFVLGRAPAQLADGFAAVVEAQRRMLAAIKPGAAPSAIFAEHNAYMRSRGLPEETRLNAHGMGYDMVERPLIRSDEDMPIAEGMCIVVHPGFVDPHQFAVICDNYLVGPTGVGECLHRTPQALIEL